MPVPQAGEALVKVSASLVSAGTERMLVEFAEKSLVGKARSRPDLVRQVVDKARREGIITTVEAAFGRLDQPMPLGYSAAGTIVGLGESLQGYKVGQRVACAGGGYAVHAEYVCVPKNLLVRLPNNVDFDAAAFTTLAAIALHGFRLAQVQLGERIGVIGLGLLGLLTVGIGRAAGCQVFGVDLDPQRAALAKMMGASAVERSEAEAAGLSFSKGRGCDAVLICADTSTADPVTLAGTIARDRARIVAVGAVGLQLPRKIYFEKELTFVNSRSYGPGRYDPAYEEGGQDYPIGYVRWTEGRNLEACVELFSSGAVDVRPLISHRFPIEQAPQAYELITGKRQEPFLGVLLTYPRAGEQVDLPADGRSGGEAQSFQVQPALERKADLRPGGAWELPFKPARLPVVKLGILGAGNFATAVMLPVLKKIEGLELVGIVSASGSSAQHAADRFGIQYAASEAERLFDDPQVNCVAILTRHHQHASQVLAALGAGKHVFCEKPLALNESELEQIEAALGQPDSPYLIVGFNRRFASLARQMAEFFKERSEPLVMHYRVNAGYIPLTHWVHDPEQGGGRIIGEGCHFIDFMSFLSGGVPQSIRTVGLEDGGRYREDNVVIQITFSDGSIGTLSYLSNGDRAFPKERIEAFSGGRVAVLDDFRSLAVIHAGRQRVYRSRLRQDKGHEQEWLDYVQALQNGQPPPIPYTQLFGVTRATFAAVQALRSGEIVSLHR